MIQTPKNLDLPRAQRPYWYGEEHPEIRSDLHYLGWGMRAYGRYPPKDDELHWSYVVILRGTPTALLADGPRQVGANDALVVAPRVRHKFGWQDVPRGLSEVLIWVWREPPLVAELRPDRGRHHIFRVSAESRKRLQSLHAACRREVASPDPFTSVALRGIRGQIDAELARQLQMQDAKSDHHLLVELAVRWMRQHLHLRSPVFLLCDYLQVARSTLDRLFAEAYGQSPSTYHSRLRMQRAEHLLKDGKMSAKEVGYELGYKHPSDFSRAFKAYKASD